MDVRLIPAKEELFHPVVQSNIEFRKSDVGEKCDVCKSLVEPPAESSDDDDLVWIQLDGAVAE